MEQVMLHIYYLLYNIKKLLTMEKIMFLFE